MAAAAAMAFDCEIKDVRIESNNGDECEQTTERKPQLKVGSQLNVRALVKLGRINLEDVSIELYHGSVDSWGNITQGSSIKMSPQEPLNGNGEHWFTGVMPCKASGRQGLAVRVLPHNADLVSPLELGLILWEGTSGQKQC